MRTVEMSAVEMQDVYFMDARLDQSSWRQANIMTMHAQRASMVGADFSQAQVMDSDLRDTRLQFANFQDTNFAVPDPRNGRTYKATDFTGAQIMGAIFTNATGFTSGLPYVEHGYPFEFYMTKGRPIDLHTPCISPMCGGFCQTSYPIWYEKPSNCQGQQPAQLLPPSLPSNSSLPPLPLPLV